jgi:hypothetical protein
MMSVAKRGTEGESESRGTAITKWKQPSLPKIASLTSPLKPGGAIALYLVSVGMKTSGNFSCGRVAAQPTSSALERMLEASKRDSVKGDHVSLMC